MTVKEMAAHLRMSYMGVKQHCLDLEKDGYLDTLAASAHQDRPARIALPAHATRAMICSPSAVNPLTLEVLETVEKSVRTRRADENPLRHLRPAHGGVPGTAKIPASALPERARTSRPAPGRGRLHGRVRAADGANGASATGPMCIVEHHSPIEDLLRRWPILARLEKGNVRASCSTVPVRREEDTASGIYRCTFYLG